MIYVTNEKKGERREGEGEGYPRYSSVVEILARMMQTMKLFVYPWKVGVPPRDSHLKRQNE
jgi:hypothetical protein